ncbi:murein DD-endopeptidase MepM/ murein hydrolase activator NlpD [Bacillus fengqiuensis]|nr:murein DD-endopeptidase MepM/ murein hydrolase activator NlpD [Bacillus fengqiuensis]
MKKIVWAVMAIIFVISFIFLGLKDQGEKDLSVKRDDSMIFPSILEGNELYVEAEVITEELNGNYVFDEIDRAFTLTMDGQNFFFIEGVPVVERDGQYEPIQQSDFLVKGKKVYLSAVWLHRFFPTLVWVEKGKVKIANEAKVEQNTQPVQAQIKNEQEIIEQLQVLSSPLKGVKPDLYPSHVPGAKRSYRGGFHEGLDWYSYSTGAVINEQTPVYAMGEGKVVRVDHGYNGYESVQEREQDLQVCQLLGKTPLYILDKLRGRQVWIQYENGVQARFAHLSNIASELEVGSKVDQNTRIGFVGNSGTSGEVNKDGTEMHLHVDLLVKGRLFWEGFTKEEVTNIIQAVF